MSLTLLCNMTEVDLPAMQLQHRAPVTADDGRPVASYPTVPAGGFIELTEDELPLFVGHTSSWALATHDDDCRVVLGENCSCH